MASPQLRHLLGPDLAVDLGSATTRVASTRVASTWDRLTLKAPSAIGETRASDLHDTERTER